MRIAIAGIHIESSTFTKHIARLGDFEVLRGDELVANYPFEQWLGTGHGVSFVGALTANAGATGPIDPDVYDAFEDEMAERLAAMGPVDGVYLDMHGAMNVLGRTRAEESWVRRVRSVVGADVVVSGSFDTHGNFSRELAELFDLAAFHRHAPHIDNEQTRERAVKNLLAVLEKGVRPAKAWVRLPALLPGERTSTVVEPGRSIFARLLPAIDDHSLIDAAMCVGFFWADEERNSAAVFTTAYDEGDAIAAATDLAETFWRDVEGFTIVTEHFGPWSEALDYALTRPARPLFLSDSGDNITAGASGDLTFALTETLGRADVLEAGIRMLFAGLVDPETVDAALEAGVGGMLTRGIGAWLDDRYAGPVGGDWNVVEALHDPVDGAVSGVLLRRGTIDVSVQRSRAAFVRFDDPGFPPGVLRGLAMVPLDAYDAVVVKNGYLFPGQVEDSGSFFMAITPGGTDLDENRLPYDDLDRPLFPWDQGFTPDLTGQLIATWAGA